MVKAGEPLGPRDIMRGAGLSSPSVAYRHLQKLVDLGLVEKDVRGNYVVKEKTSPRGFMWVGRIIIPRLMLYSFFFIGALIVETTVLSIRLLVKEPVDNILILLVSVTAISAALFMLEGLRLKKKIEE
ncbi:helix-turn-helix domain-containing protein [Candidatus Bathyarchaeota archaeon]|nr:helix-turn-helix domain-containing protein [Candidatus Bathyarchaeota archaeon]